MLKTVMRYFAFFIIFILLAMTACANTSVDPTTGFSQILADDRLQQYNNYWLQEAIILSAAGVEPDIDMLVDFYESADDFSMLRLFPTRFCKTLCSTEELMISTHTALSLANFILQKESKEALFEYITDQTRTDWLNYIGVQREYSDPYDGFLDAFTIKGLNPMIAEAHNATFNFRTYSVPHSPPLGFDTASRMETFLYREMHGIEYISEWLNANAGEKLSFVKTPDMVTYQNGEHIRHGAAYPKSQLIHLANTIGHLHEYIHIILYTPYGWLNEGLAVYLSEIVYPSHYRRILFEEYGLRVFLSDESIRKYESLIRDTYYMYTGNELSYPPDMRALIDTFSLILLFDDDDWLREYFIFRPIYILDRLNLNGNNIGNEMSRYEAASFVAYLTDVYSFEKLLQLAEPWAVFESVFGKNYEELRSDWIKSLSKT